MRCRAWVALILIFSCTLQACKPSATETAQQPIARPTASTGIKPCDLLTLEQVATVVPNVTVGTVLHAGKSPVTDVDAYQCSYTNSNGDLLTVIVHVAHTHSRFMEMAPDSTVRENRRRIDIGQEGWVVSTASETKIKAVKGHNVVDLELSTVGAESKETQLVELMRAVVTRL